MKVALLYWANLQNGYGNIFLAKKEVEWCFPLDPDLRLPVETSFHVEDETIKESLVLKVVEWHFFYRKDVLFFRVDVNTELSEITPEEFTKWVKQDWIRGINQMP